MSEIVRADHRLMNRRLQRLNGRLHSGDAQYDGLKARLRDLKKGNVKITRTMYWNWCHDSGGDFPEDLFYNTPPVAQAQDSNRVLVTGTKVETNSMYQMLEALKGGPEAVEELHRKNREEKLPQLLKTPMGRDISVIHQILIGGVQPDYRYCSQVGSFWGEFFGDSFLDRLDENSVPRAIVATGFMRNYNCIGGETLEVMSRLKRVAHEWRIPIYRVPADHP